ncbi:transketolase family protein [Faecalispora jeddahensis]|jgi:transketolase|uniref:transketolase family protein n=1 Tax=Faecalispora jeddahensis TaxID=1414721 RepID=UPI001898C653|nr:transketolase C-terminal domain-containing protein [Faecalispora jeddahensis]
MNKIANKQAICDVLLQESEHDQDIVVLCSDSRGSGSMTPFAEQRPKQFVETGIAEQNLVTISAGLAKCGKKSFAVSPACFLSTRSMEQAKVDVAYNHANVKLIGISGGVSYGALGLTHHSTNDIAAMASIVNMRVYLPSDRLQTECLIRALLKDGEPAYIRVGRNAVEDVYEEESVPFTLNKATLLRDGTDVTIIACGEMVSAAKQAGELLEQKGVSARVLDMYCLKPIDREAVLKAARETRGIVTIEEHTAFGGLGSMVSQIVCAEHPVRVKSLTLPDEPVITGKSQQVFDYYGLNAEGIARAAMELI